MDGISNIPNSDGKKRIVIVGGGFGGLTVVKNIDKNKFQIILIDKNNNHQFQPLLYQVATSGIEPSNISFPFRKMFHKHKNFIFRMGEVYGVERELNILKTSIGNIEYDYLIIAIGCETNYYGNLLLEQNTLALKTTSDALYMRNCLLQNIENAINTDNPELRKEFLSFIIVGGGPTGVEMTGALAEMKKFILPKDYPELKLEDVSIHLINGAERLLSSFSLESSLKTERHLKELGVNIINGTYVSDYKESILSLSDGSCIQSRNVIWVAGVIPNKLEGLNSSSFHKSGRIITDSFNRVVGENNIFAIGDIAIIENDKNNQQVAQMAIQQAKNLCFNLNNGFSTKKAFKYYNKGSMATIGRNAAIAEIGKYKFSGFIAWSMWCFIHLISILGTKNKLFVFINWIWNYLTYDQSLRIIIFQKNKKG